MRTEHTRLSFNEDFSVITHRIRDFTCGTIVMLMICIPDLLALALYVNDQ